MADATAWCRDQAKCAGYMAPTPSCSPTGIIEGDAPAQPYQICAFRLGECVCVCVAVGVGENGGQGGLRPPGGVSPSIMPRVLECAPPVAAHFKDSWAIRRAAKNAGWSSWAVPGPRPKPPYPTPVSTLPPTPYLPRSIWPGRAS